MQKVPVAYRRKTTSSQEVKGYSVKVEAIRQGHIFSCWSQVLPTESFTSVLFMIHYFDFERLSNDETIFHPPSSSPRVNFFFFYQLLKLKPHLLKCKDKHVLLQKTLRFKKYHLKEVLSKLFIKPEIFLH